MAGFPLKWALSGLSLIMVLLSLSLFREAKSFSKQTNTTVAAMTQSGWRAWKAKLSLAWGGLLPPALLIGLPLGLHLDWAELLRAAPDLSWWMLLYLVATFVLPIAKVRAVMTRLKTNGRKATP
jgi:hypothetical protein